MVPEGAVEEQAAPPWWAKVVVAVTLIVIVVAFVVPIRFTFWPITSWELFSRIRSGEQKGWVVTVVDDDGVESPMPFSRLGPGQQRWLIVSKSLPSRTVEERKAICRGWADDAVAALGDDAVAEVRVHRVTRRAADRVADPPVEVERELWLHCEPS